jgi:hypothetical protein
VNKEDVDVNFELLKSKQEKLSELNQQLQNLMFTEETEDSIIEEEFQICDEYDKKFLNTKLKVEAALQF